MSCMLSVAPQNILKYILREAFSEAVVLKHNRRPLIGLQWPNSYTIVKELQDDLLGSKGTISFYLFVNVPFKMFEMESAPEPLRLKASATSITFSVVKMLKQIVTNCYNWMQTLSCNSQGSWIGCMSLDWFGKQSQRLPPATWLYRTYIGNIGIYTVPL